MVSISEYYPYFLLFYKNLAGAGPPVCTGVPRATVLSGRTVLPVDELAPDGKKE
jgi:hypothetical protein